MNGLKAIPSLRRRRLVLGLIGLAALAVSGIGAYLASKSGSIDLTAAIPQAIAAGPEVAPLGPELPAPRQLPELSFQDARGKPRTLSDFRGKTVLLNVWATWCVPCRKEMPALDRLQQLLGGPQFEVLALSIDTGGIPAVRSFFKELGIRYLAIYVDPSMEASDKLRVVGVPTTLLVDPAGRERWRKIGPAEWDSPDVVKAMRAQLQGAAK